MTDHRYLQDLKNLSAKAKDTAAQAKARAIEKYWPSIERVCRESVGPAALKVARDDEKLTGIARAVYPALRSAKGFLPKLAQLRRIHAGEG